MAGEFGPKADAKLLLVAACLLQGWVHRTIALTTIALTTIALTRKQLLQSRTFPNLTRIF